MIIYLKEEYYNEHGELLEYNVCHFDFNSFLSSMFNIDFEERLKSNSAFSLKLYDAKTNKLILKYSKGDKIPWFNATYFRSLDEYITEDKLRASLLLPLLSSERIRVVVYDLFIGGYNILPLCVGNVCRNTITLQGTTYTLSSVTDFNTAYSKSVYFKIYGEKDYL